MFFRGGAEVIVAKAKVEGEVRIEFPIVLKEQSALIDGEVSGESGGNARKRIDSECLRERIILCEVERGSEKKRAGSRWRKRETLEDLSEFAARADEMPAALDADSVAPLIGAEVSAVLEDVAERSGDAGNGDLRNDRVAFRPPRC